MKRLTILLPIVVLVGILVGLASDRWSAPDSGLPSFTRTQPPQFDPFVAPEGSLVLRGRVVDPAGEPVPQASVYLRSGGVPHWTYTDDEGGFELAGLFEGDTDATVLAWGFPPEAFRVAAGGAPAELVLPPRNEPPRESRTPPAPTSAGASSARLRPGATPRDTSWSSSRAAPRTSSPGRSSAGSRPTRTGRSPSRTSRSGATA